MIRSTAFAAALFTLAMPALAGPEAFQPGTVVPDYGKVAMIDGVTLPADTEMKVAFDIGEAGPDDAISRRLETPARFLNMHAAAGVDPENLHVALVVHGAAGRDLPEGRHSVWRYRYHEWVAERFASSFADQVGGWCKRNGIAMTGHTGANAARIWTWCATFSSTVFRRSSARCTSNWSRMLRRSKSTAMR